MPANVHSFRVGTKVTAKYMATTAGVRCPGKWFPGVVKKVNADGTYNIQYDDGDRENAVLEKFVKATQAASASGAAADPAADAAQVALDAAARRSGKRKAPLDLDPTGAAADPAADAAQVALDAAARRSGKRKAPLDLDPKQPVSTEVAPAAPVAPSRGKRRVLSARRSEPEPVAEDDNEGAIEVDDNEALAMNQEGAIVLDSDDDDDEKEEEVAIVENGGAGGSRAREVAVAEGEPGEGADDEVQMTGRSGDLALVDVRVTAELGT